MLDWLNKHSKVGLLVISVISLGFAYKEYKSNIQQQKVNKSLEYFNEYRSGELLTARIDFHKEFDDLIRKSSSLSNCDLEKRMIGELADGPNRYSYDVVVEFFDAVNLCVTIKECDQETVISLFAFEAESLLSMVLPVVKFNLESNPNRGLGLQKIAESANPNRWQNAWRNENCPSKIN